ncbi:hypothetical protein Thimo_1286 [Thioflavicoccus mobilis 8321]|uniref:DUF4194 domain-containing protein n=1 Tax=Thioflavicoccus mobilis 8321 TaxID=765912 RepID=L0GTK7_9GAMM|nr:DUF4194 domain-containing protein [Thioflavicoccus mobilis]AGA90083.1 hypothetical protein Thimo_1286 [Thioflavicoccus mobilis 8321]
MERPEFADTDPQSAEAPGERTGETGGLYPNDTGVLPEAARRALVQLLSGPSLEGRRHPRLWPALVQHREEIRSRLAELFLELIVDADRQVAFTRQADTGELEAPILLRRSPLTFLDSVLLLYLRGTLVEADTQGVAALVSLDEMIQQLGLYEPQASTDRVGFEKRARAAIEKAKKNSLISSIRGSPERFEVSASLKLMLGPEEVESLGRIYDRLAMTDAGSNRPDDAEDDA